jgi:hypothetical protein
MSKAALGKVILVAVGTAIVYAAGYVTAHFQGKPEREKMAKENERLRTILCAYLDVFETTNAAMEAVIADIAANPPLNAKDLAQRLRHHGVTEEQVDRIIADLDIIGIFKAGAA